ncbi:hypothetical protein [Streptomyces sp. NPDC018045]|uniref:hypothetical protein n=1 Tax=Streptomyces sp. NPDC018045 TaxID=3365037 RepID=UPI00378F82DE
MRNIDTEVGEPPGDVPLDLLMGADTDEGDGFVDVLAAASGLVEQFPGVAHASSVAPRVSIAAFKRLLGTRRAPAAGISTSRPASERRRVARLARLFSRTSLVQRAPSLAKCEVSMFINLMRSRR